jgi:hypothetical protein
MFFFHGKIKAHKIRRGSGRGPEKQNGWNYSVRQSVSRVLSSPFPDGSDKRWPFIWDARRRTPRATYPGDDAEMRPRAETRMSPLFGLAPGGVYPAGPVAGTAVRSYRTLSPLPAVLAADRRFAFCGTFPGVTPAGRYPAPYFRGARTFLPPFPKKRRAAIRPSDAK